MKRCPHSIFGFLSAFFEDRCQEPIVPPLGLIEDQSLPKRTLVLETLSEGQIRSGELAIRSLKELLEYSDEVNYASYLTDEALSELSQSDSDALLVDSENQTNNAANLPYLL